MIVGVELAGSGSVDYSVTVYNSMTRDGSRLLEGEGLGVWKRMNASSFFGVVYPERMRRGTVSCRKIHSTYIPYIAFIPKNASSLSLTVDDPT